MPWQESIPAPHQDGAGHSGPRPSRPRSGAEASRRHSSAGRRVRGAQWDPWCCAHGLNSKKAHGGEPRPSGSGDLARTGKQPALAARRPSPTPRISRRFKNVYHAPPPANRNTKGCIFLFLSFSFFLFFFFWAAPTAYGASQARGLIGAVATGLHHSHSNARSESCLQPTPQLMAMLDP